MASVGINFRSTSGYVTDDTDQDYSLGSTSTRSLNGFSWAWSSDITANTRNRITSSPFAPELSGVAFFSNTGTSTADFLVTLPSAGNYKIGIALGDQPSTQVQTCKIYDDSSLLATICTNISTPIGRWLDITATERTASEWQAAMVTTQYSFSSTTLKVSIGGGSGTGNSTISHLYVEEVPSAGQPAMRRFGREIIGVEGVRIY